MTQPHVGVIVMAYGTPSGPDDLEAYYTHIRRGRPPTPELLADLRRRYDAIGGISTLRTRTEAQAAGIAAALEATWPGEHRVTLGMKHAAPFIEDAVDAAVAGGARKLVGLVLAPHFSSASIGEYLARLDEAAARHGVPATGIRSWATDTAYVEMLARSVREVGATLPEPRHVVFTAHSLPTRIVAAGDPYPDELAATATAVAQAAGLGPWADWGIAWQSAGRTPEPWLGPDILTVIADLAATGRSAALLVCPCGFTSDHLEVAYDLDIEASAAAEAAGLAFARTAVMNDDPAVLASLAERIHAAT